MRHIPFRLGPLAILLTVISICMTVLGILSFATARADSRLAEKYAATVRLRYELETQGQLFLREAGEACARGAELRGLTDVETDENEVVRKTFEESGFRLTVGIIPDSETGFRVVEWSMGREWEPGESMGDLWYME